MYKNFSRIIPFKQKNSNYGSYLLLDDKSRKSYILKDAAGSRTIASPLIYLPYVLTDVSTINSRRAAFIARKEMKAGIISFNDNKVKIDKEIKLTSYPENISSADVNDDNKEDLLLSGHVFGGISVLLNIGESFREVKLNASEFYSNAVFADINSDGFPDIAALNALKNVIDIFYNRGDGSFYFVRSFNSPYKIVDFSFDFLNSDDYIDFFFYGRKNITLIYGNESASYDKRINIESKYVINKIDAQDLNGDNKADFAYISKNENYGGIVFSGISYSEILYLNKSKLEDFSLQSSKNELLFLSSAGYVYKYSHLSSFDENYNLGVAGNPTGITWFDRNNDKHIDIAYFDRADNKLKILVKNKRGIYRRYYEYQVFDDLNEIYVVENSPSIKTFYCYALDKKHIEIFRIDFEKNKFERTSLYAKGNVTQMKMSKLSQNRVYIVYKINDDFYSAIIERRQNNYSIRNQRFLDKNILDEAIAFRDNNVNYYYMTSEPNILSVKRKDEDSTTILTTVNINKPTYGFTLAGEFFNNINSVINFGGKENIGVMIVTNDSTYIIDTISLARVLPVKEKKNLYYFKDDSLSIIYFYNAGDRTLGKLYFTGNSSIMVNEFLSGLNIDYYFIYKLRKNISYIVYSDPKKNCITFRKII